jgi:diaminohydroxyphosphoribosylaminopyrimidine deaminase/5-amino-6-(5-phosphoribosylamino)uracil reductase
VKRTTKTSDRADDARFMRRAIELAEKFRGRTSPNPIVGAVIVKNGEIIAEGAHPGPGEPHAEIVALRKLGGRAPGATMYTTLEPCMHHGRTPPCAPAVIAAGIVRCVVGSEDPIPGHGGGMKALRRAKVKVARALVEECDASNRAFMIWARYRRPAFTIKAAITLDGKIATVSGESQWITGPEARAEVHRMRDQHDAVMVGIGTLLADDPRLTARFKGARNPVRVIVDSTLRTPARAKALKKGVRRIVATTDAATDLRERAIGRTGAEVWRYPVRTGGVPLDRLARALGEQGITSVLVEAGGQLTASLLAAGLADTLVLYVAPKIVGGPAQSWVGGDGIAKLAEAHGFRFEGAPVQVGDDLRITAVRG